MAIEENLTCPFDRPLTGEAHVRHWERRTLSGGARIEVWEWVAPEKGRHCWKLVNVFNADFGGST